MINEIKNRIYEAEGLLELLHLRKDKESELLPMIEAKLREALAGVDKMIGGSATGSADATDRSYDRTEGTPDISFEDEEPIYAAPDTDTDCGAGDESTDMLPDSDRSEKEPAEQRTSPAFCLNDRYRFRRAIFGGSSAEFNAAMTHLATLDSYEEAEEYFYGDMGLDPEDQDVVDFMAVIKNYFGL